MSVEDISLNKTCGECPLNAEIDGNNIYFQINCDIYICNACDTEACNLWGVKSMPDRNYYENDFAAGTIKTLYIVIIGLAGGYLVYLALRVIRKGLREVN
jgi:hypothetical protein